MTRKYVEYLSVLSLVLTTAAHAGIPEKFGLGAWQTSLSGAGTAALSDPTAAYFNPAGLASGISDATGIKNSLFFGLGYQQPDFKISTTAGSALAKSNAELGENVIAYSTLNVAFTLDLRSVATIPGDIPVAIGLAAALAADGSDIVKLSENSGKFYNFVGMGRDAVRPAVAASLALQPWKEHWSIGAGIAFLAAAEGKLDIPKIHTDARPPVSELTIELRLKPGAIAGTQLRHNFGTAHTFFLGFAWRQENYVSADVAIEAQLPPISGISVKHVTAIHLISYYEPHTITAGIGYSWKRFSLFLDAEYQLWSRFSRGITRELLEGLPAFKDIIAARAGSEIILPFWGIKMRGGYAFVPAFTPDQSGISNYLDNDKHIISFGLGRFFHALPFLRSSVKFELSGQWQYWQTRQTIKQVQDAMTDGTYQPGYFYGGNVFLGHFSVTLYI